MTDRSHGPNVTEVQWSARPMGHLYECATPQCGVPGSAPYMFNLACDPRLTDPEEFKSKIRCKRCAEDIATANGKQLNEPGCGVFPLTVTLAARNRSETDPVPPGVSTYACSKPGCRVARPADQMYNRSMGKRMSDEQAGLPDVLCHEHAHEDAALRGTVPCVKGSNLYRLSFTLKEMRKLNANRSDGHASPLWRGRPPGTRD